MDRVWETHARVWTVYREERKTKDTRLIIHAHVWTVYGTHAQHTPVYDPCTEEERKTGGHTRPKYTPVYGPCRWHTPNTHARVLGRVPREKRKRWNFCFITWFFSLPSYPNMILGVFKTSKTTKHHIYDIHITFIFNLWTQLYKTNTTSWRDGLNM